MGGDHADAEKLLYKSIDIEKLLDGIYRQRMDQQISTHTWNQRNN